jgi:hypothetical protein
MNYANTAAIRAHLVQTEDDWTSPDFSFLDEGLLAPPTIPIEVFGSWAPWLKSFAASASAPVDYACAGLLAASSASVGAVRKVSPWIGWSEYPALWCLNVGNPSASKSPVYGPIIGALKDLERDEGADFADQRRRFETDQRAAREEKERWERDVGDAVKAGRPAPIKPVVADDPEEPKPPRLVVSDATIESLTPLFKANPRGVMLARDELSGWVGNFGRYGGDGDAAYFLERFNGLGVTVDRVKAGNIHAERALLSVFGGIQPERLTELLLRRADDGLVARLLMFFPDPVGRRRPLDAPDMSTLSDALRRLRSLGFAEDAEGRPTPRILPLAPAALLVFEEWWTENGQAARHASGFHQGFLGKGPGVVLRLALLLELLEWAYTAGRPEPQAVSRGSMLYAQEMFDEYLVGMAARVFGGADRSPEDRAAASLLRHVRQTGEATVNARDVQRRKLPGLRKADDVNTAFTHLAEGGWVRFQGGRNAESPGRQRQDWSINPKLWEAR